MTTRIELQNPQNIILDKLLDKRTPNSFVLTDSPGREKLRIKQKEEIHKGFSFRVRRKKNNEYTVRTTKEQTTIRSKPGRKISYVLFDTSDNRISEGDKESVLMLNKQISKAIVGDSDKKETDLFTAVHLSPDSEKQDFENYPVVIPPRRHTPPEDFVGLMRDKLLRKLKPGVKRLRPNIKRLRRLARV